MSTELDVSWFDLKKYDALAELDLSGWHQQLLTRNHITVLIENNELLDAEKIIKKLQNQPIVSLLDSNYWENQKKYNLSTFPFNTFSVRSTPIVHIWLNRNESRIGNSIWNLCDIDYLDSLDEAERKIIDTPFDLLCKQAHIQETEKFTNITIDLTATDEQILNDFQHWLSEYRKAIGYKSKNKNFINKNLKDWFESQLLPYIDLTLSVAIEQKKITQVKIAELIFQDSGKYFDKVDRLRRTTKPKADWLIRDETLRAIEAQLCAAA
jgi:hypothetical protein